MRRMSPQAEFFTVPFKAIRQIEKKYKRSFAKTLRYKRYRRQESLKEWKYFLRNDAILLTHAKEMAGLTKKFLEYNHLNGVKISKQVKKELAIAAWIHDWGELIIDGEGIGDITYDQKNDFHLKTELNIFKKVINNIPNPKERKLLLRIYRDIVYDQKSELGQIFNVVENLGYLLNAIGVYQGKKSKRIENYKGLVGNVLSNQIEKLGRLSSKYPYVEFILNKNNLLISQMFKDIKKSAIPLGTGNKPCFSKEKLENNYRFWISYLRKFNKARN